MWAKVEKIYPRKKVWASCGAKARKVPERSSDEVLSWEFTGWKEIPTEIRAE